jgi:hypothetical protein
MVDPGGEELVGAEGIGSDGKRASGRCSVGSMAGIGFGFGFGFGFGIGSGRDREQKKIVNEVEQFLYLQVREGIRRRVFFIIRFSLISDKPGVLRLLLYSAKASTVAIIYNSFPFKK